MLLSSSQAIFTKLKRVRKFSFSCKISMRFSIQFINCKRLLGSPFKYTARCELPPTTTGVVTPLKARFNSVTILSLVLVTSQRNVNLINIKLEALA